MERESTTDSKHHVLLVSTEDPLLDQQCRFAGGLEKQFGRAVGERPDWFEKEWEETDW